MQCKIRPWRPEDAAALAEALNNKSVQDNLRDGLPYPYTARDASWYIGEMLGAAPQSTFAFAITLDDKAIGSIGAFRQSNIHSQTAEMGYYIGEPYWGNGYMTAAVRALCDHIFCTTDIMRIFATPFAGNKGSCRVLEKAGFVHEGTLRAAAVKNGQVLDLEMYGLIKEV